MSGGGIVEKALSSLGRGFDVTSDFRLKYCKGKRRLVLLNEAEKREVAIPGFGVYGDVSVDIKCDKGDRTRYQSDVLEFNQMSEWFNQKSSLPGKIPSGLFNSMFGFNSNSWARDAAATKCLALDCYYIILFNLHIDRYPLVLCDEVRKAVPSSWDPSALARFIENYGTHVIVGLGIGGLDVVLVRQDQSSNLEPAEIKKHLESLGDQLFTGACTLPLHSRSKDHNKKKAPEAFNVFDPKPVFVDSFSSVTSKDGISVICSKRGGEPSVQSHCEWLLTVPSTPDAVVFSFIPITSLLQGVPGKGFLSHAINLYLRYKPPISDLQYFLDFQYHKMWAPIHNDFPLGPMTNRAIPTPSLHFNLMGPRLYVNPIQVRVGERPVTGMRLYLEGMKCNRLAIHLEHLSSTPVILQNKIEDMLRWRGSDEIGDEQYFEAVQWKKFSHICTAPVKYDPEWAPGRDVAFIVTGAQLHVKKHESKSVLHLRLSFSKVVHSGIARSIWAQGPSELSQKSGFFSAISTSISGNPDKEMPKQVVVDSAVFPTGPPVPVHTQKLLKFVDLSELCKGAKDSPGHWLVTGAKLDLENGKICLQVKFSLLSYFS
ncbi:PREDICTED: MACPF domain-containing protein At1g14780 [Nelumbo nucifera]|uniref:MACPF domain-containing protein At1g14780 n=1 Tax=Nelumbo nucifera TaxID=4432 RepID=A0A1U8ATN9_NELNU|nr:PREDICTED: MACPF domain-containing protein At1g14780 [Nelumbo nucifera]